jgi:putative transposase
VARKPRQEVAGGVFHVYNRGNDRRPIYVDDQDYRRYVDRLAATVARHGWRCLAYCLMPNHMHLLVETPQPNLGKGMQMLHGEYGAEFNRRHGRDGHVFGGRFKASLIRTSARFVEMVGYIALNPVAAQLCRRPEDWPWSSHVATVSGPPPTWLDLEHLFGYLRERGDAGRRQYVDVVELALSTLLASRTQRKHIDEACKSIDIVTSER